MSSINICKIAFYSVKQGYFKVLWVKGHNLRVSEPIQIIFSGNAFIRRTLLKMKF